MLSFQMKRYALALGMLLAFILQSTATFGQNTCVDGPSTLIVGNSGTYSTGQLATAYYWFATGPLTITGGNTSSTVQVYASAVGTGEVCITYFDQGQCFTCCMEVTVVGSGGGSGQPTCEIRAAKPMCWGDNSNCATRWGTYTLYCDGQPTNANWEILPGSNNGCVTFDCNGTQLYQNNTTWIQPVPQCNYANQQVTIYARHPVTNVILADSSFTILECDEGGTNGGVKGFKMNSGSALPNSGPYKVVAVDLTSGKQIVLSNDASTIGGKLEMAKLGQRLNKGQLYGINIYQNGELVKASKMTFDK